MLGPEFDVHVRISRERPLAEFRQHSISRCLSTYEPTTKDELGAVLERIVRADPVGRKIALV